MDTVLFTVGDIRDVIGIAYDKDKLNHKFSNFFVRPSNSEVIAEGVTLFGIRSIKRSPTNSIE